MAEDRRIALTALVVTAFVGVGAPTGAVIATNEHDSARLHAEQAQADRTELRKVLDDAATALYISQTRFQTLCTRPDGRVQGVFTVLTSLRQQLDRLAQRYNRVAIRLGRTAPATVQISRAIEIANDLTIPCVNLATRRRELDDRRFLRAFVRYSAQTNRFIDAAHRVAQSTTD